MNLDEYQTRAFATAKIDWLDSSKRHVPAFGAIGELGSLVSELKKSLRDGQAYTEGHQNVAEEFGDILWYLAAISSRYQLNLSKLIKTARVPKLSGRKYAHIYAMVRTIPVLTEAFEKLPVRPAPSQLRALAESVGASGRATIHALRVEKLNLSAVLVDNLTKVHGMFSREVRQARCFDSDAPAYERLPRKLDVQFLERKRSKGRVEVILRVNDLNIGDRLTDNAAVDDGYRYHDAFHLAYAAALGWSPVVRATFRCKRKSNPKKDEVEDGARAAIIEEAIAQTVFRYASGHSMLRNLDRLDHGILKFVTRMVANLEAGQCEMHEWQRAILIGFEAFRNLDKNKGGWLHLDAETQSLKFSREGPGAV